MKKYNIQFATWKSILDNIACVLISVWLYHVLFWTLSLSIQEGVLCIQVHGIKKDRFHNV